LNFKKQIYIKETAYYFLLWLADFHLVVGYPQIFA